MTLRQPERGYALILVMGALALLTLVASQFAQRIDGLMRQTTALKAEAQGDIAAASAHATALYTVLTQPNGPLGYGGLPGPVLPADGRWIRLDGGAAVRLQDPRGLLSLNVIDREPLFRLLVAAGADPAQVPRLIDSLEDYTDVDSLRRLNGAELPQYLEAGIAGPRNDWMLSTRELCQIPAWREHEGLCEKIAPWVSTRRGVELNPNTAPLPVLRALLPQARPGQIERLAALRGVLGFQTTAQAEGASGLPLQALEPIFWLGNTLNLSVWAEGQPRATEYTLLFTPEGLRAPWLTTEMHRVARPVATDLTTPLGPSAVMIPAAEAALDRANVSATTSSVRPGP